MILGIDPGLNGGICLMAANRKILHLSVMPTIDKKQIDLTLFDGLLGDLKEKKLIHHCFLEQVGARPGQSVVAMFKFGRVYGNMEAMISAHKIPMTLVTPQAWQKVTHLGVEKQIDPKQRSLLAAKRLYPEQDFLATERSKVPHDGLVDAILIAEYGCRIYAGGCGEF